MGRSDQQRGGQRRRMRGGGGGGGRGSRRRSGRGPAGRRRGFSRQAAEGGNQRERIAIESGALVLIDQFMLANPQFMERLKALRDEQQERKNDLVADYGGCVVELEPGTYKIDRDPFKFYIVIHPDGDRPELGHEFARENCDGLRELYIDTRCVAMIDRELLDDTELLEKYQQLWFSGQDKACRDLIRDNGGAVRYGFNRFGDELSVRYLEEEQAVCMWPKNMPVVDIDLSARSSLDDSTSQEEVGPEVAEEAHAE